MQGALPCWASIATLVASWLALSHSASASEPATLDQGFRLTKGDPQVPIHLDFLIPEAGEHTVSFWSEAAQGEAAVGLTGADHWWG